MIRKSIVAGAAFDTGTTDFTQSAQPAMFNIFAPAPASAMSYRPDAH